MSDGKYGERAERVIKTKYPGSKMYILPEQDPNTFLDDVEFPDEFLAEVESSDVIVSYHRHPDLVEEMCDLGKPVIVAIYFGEGFERQLQEVNPNVLMPKSMCLIHKLSGNADIDAFLTAFGLPKYAINLKYDYLGHPMIQSVTIDRQSPCGASSVGAEMLKGKPITPESINEFALVVRQECREPQSLMMRRDDMAEASAGTHVLALLEGLKESAPELFREGGILHDYTKERFPELLEK